MLLNILFDRFDKEDFLLPVIHLLSFTVYQNYFVDNLLIETHLILFSQVNIQLNRNNILIIILLFSFYHQIKYIIYLFFGFSNKNTMVN